MSVETGGGCFDAGTKVLMADGSLKNIEDIKVNDEILAYNENSKQISIDKVMHTFSFDNQNNDLVTLTFTDGTVLHTTKTHPFLTENGWVALKPEQGKHITSTMMQVGQKFYKTVDNSTVNFVELADIKYTPITDTAHRVYNLEIDKNDTFFVNGIVAHNMALVDGGEIIKH